MKLNFGHQIKQPYRGGSHKNNIITSILSLYLPDYLSKLFSEVYDSINELFSIIYDFNSQVKLTIYLTKNKERRIIWKAMKWKTTKNQCGEGK